MLADDRNPLRDHVYTRPTDSNYHQIKNVSFDVNAPTIFHITEKIRIYEAALSDELQQLRRGYIDEFGNFQGWYPDGSLHTNTRRFPPSGKRDRSRSPRKQGQNPQRKFHRGPLSIAQQRTESRLATNKFKQRETKTYNELGLGPRIPIARDPNDQATVKYAHKALQEEIKAISDLSDQAANLLRDEPRV